MGEHKCAKHCKCESKPKAKHHTRKHGAAAAMKAMMEKVRSHKKKK